MTIACLTYLDMLVQLEWILGLQLGFLGLRFGFEERSEAKPETENSYAVRAWSCQGLCVEHTEKWNREMESTVIFEC